MVYCSAIHLGWSRYQNLIKFPNTTPKPHKNKAYITCDEIKKMGTYLTPALMFPFSKIAIINDEKNAITATANLEKLINKSGSNFFDPAPANAEETPELPPEVDVASIPVTFWITSRRLKDNANNNGAINITIAEIKIIYDITEAFISSFNAFVFFIS